MALLGRAEHIPSGAIGRKERGAWSRQHACQPSSYTGGDTLPSHLLVFREKDSLRGKLIWYIFPVSMNQVRRLLTSRHFLFTLHSRKWVSLRRPPGWCFWTPQADLHLLEVSTAVCLNYSSTLTCLLPPRSSSRLLRMPGFTSPSLQLPLSPSMDKKHWT